MGADEFGRCSPAFVHALYQAWETRERRMDYRAGVIAATVANAAGAKKRGASGYGPADFFASLAEDDGEWPDQDTLERKMAAAFGAAAGG